MSDDLADLVRQREEIDARITAIRQEAVVTWNDELNVLYDAFLAWRQSRTGFTTDDAFSSFAPTMRATLGAVRVDFTYAREHHSGSLLVQCDPGKAMVQYNDKLPAADELISLVSKFLELSGRAG
jgi:hypothetical protein